jgi:hypothetical protein
MRNCRAGAPPANAIISASDALALQRERASQAREYSYFTRNGRVSPAEQADMKSLSLLVAVILAFASSDLIAQNKIDLQPSDTIISILQRNTGQTVELRMKSGEKIGGKVEKVGDKLVHLSQLTGAEFFDAAVDTADVAAVIVRTKTK